MAHTVEFDGNNKWRVRVRGKIVGGAKAIVSVKGDKIDKFEASSYAFNYHRLGWCVTLEEAIEAILKEIDDKE